MPIGMRVTGEMGAPIWFSKHLRRHSEVIIVRKKCDGGTMEMSTAMVMDLLRSRVPLSLLYDLADPMGPGSAEIMDVEAGRLDPQGLESLEEALV